MKHYGLMESASALKLSMKTTGIEMDIIGAIEGNSVLITTVLVFALLAFHVGWIIIVAIDRDK